MRLKLATLFFGLLERAASTHTDNAKAGEKDSAEDMLQVAFQGYKYHPERAVAVKEAFKHSWDGYMRYAFPGDTLEHLTHGRLDDR